MEELKPGIWHWTAFRDTIGQEVSSYWIEPAGIVIDPMVPPGDGLDWFKNRDVQPQQLVLTIGLHWRDCDAYRDEFGDIPVRVPAPGLHRFEGTDRQAEKYEWNEELAPGVTAIEIAGIAPDEGALHIDHSGGAIALGDGLIRAEGGAPPSFVPDFLMGDDPETVKASLRDSFGGLLAREPWDTLLLAHGAPLVGNGREALKEFVS